MAPFNISRIHTEHGIFRLSGNWVKSKNTSQDDNFQNLTITSLAFLGTDGWVDLDLTTKASQKITSALSPVVFEHLYSQTMT
ncbi:hypothetical protein [Shewanella sp. UCD-KL12]|uniref:hypothetical protein n=1 Tax=Shewanella sp. UCD-KL12 TaxID=1917163 RepID=UPI000970DB9C|nr:hypothetical protein [Shewanella sp. UCD-KL12]